MFLACWSKKKDVFTLLVLVLKGLSLRKTRNATNELIIILFCRSSFENGQSLPSPPPPGSFSPCHVMLDKTTDSHIRWERQNWLLYCIYFFCQITGYGFYYYYYTHTHTHTSNFQCLEHHLSSAKPHLLFLTNTFYAVSHILEHWFPACLWGNEG